MTRTVRRAFTLIELLVVITILVILLALLAPALDQAIYQAELAVCGTNLRAIATGANVYAMDHGRIYPGRSHAQYAASIANDEYENLRHGIVDQPKYDVRPTIQSYIALETLLDPLVPKISLAQEDSGAHFVEGSYQMRFGLGFSGHKAMNRVGDRWTWTDSLTYPGQPRTYSFDVIAEDSDRVTTVQSGAALGNHPDADGVMATNFDRTGDATNVVYSRWENLRTNQRGPIDMNSAYADGSVQRLNRLPINSRLDSSTHDERIVRVPFWVQNSNWDAEWINLPKP